MRRNKLSLNSFNHFILKMVARVAAGAFVISVSACSSISTLPKTENVKVSREDADKDCQFISKIEGRSLSKTAAQDDVLKDLTQEAANKGANYLVVKQYSATGTAVTGMAYNCP